MQTKLVDQLFIGNLPHINVSESFEKKQGYTSITSINLSLYESRKSCFSLYFSSGCSGLYVLHTRCLEPPQTFQIQPTVLNKIDLESPWTSWKMQTELAENSSKLTRTSLEPNWVFKNHPKPFQNIPKPVKSQTKSLLNKSIVEVTLTRWNIFANQLLNNLKSVKNYTKPVPNQPKPGQNQLHQSATSLNLFQTNPGISKPIWTILKPSLTSSDPVQTSLHLIQTNWNQFWSSLNQFQMDSKKLRTSDQL